MNLFALALFAGLFVTWCLLSGHYSGLLLTLGAVSCGVAVVLYLQVRKGTQGKVAIGIPGLLIYTAWLFKEIVKSAIAVLIAVLDKRRRFPEFFEVSTGNLNETGRVMYANSITLTPGTVSTRVGEESILVHGVIPGARQDLGSGEMLRRVAALKGTTER